MKWGWLLAVADPVFLVALLVAAGLPLLLLPAPLGQGVAGAAALLLLWLNYHIEESARRAPPRLGAEALEGKTAVALDPLQPRGIVRCGGETWRALEIRGRMVPPGDTVRVVRVRGLELQVELSPRPSPASPES